MPGARVSGSGFCPNAGMGGNLFLAVFLLGLPAIRGSAAIPGDHVHNGPPSWGPWTFLGLWSRSHGSAFDPDKHEGDFHKEMGLDLPTYALVLGIVSGLSLPLAACLGVKLSPIDDKVCAGMMAFGAGALLFAVTVELYGHALRELDHGRMGLLEMFSTILAALLGAMFYVSVNRKLDSVFASEEEEEDDSQSEDVDAADAEKQPIMASPRQARTSYQACPPLALGSVPESASVGRSPGDQPPSGRSSLTGHSPRSQWAKLRSAVRSTSPSGMNAMRRRISVSLPYEAEVQLETSRTSGRVKGLYALMLDPSVEAVEDVGEVTSEQATEEGATEASKRKARQVAFALFVGLLIDGVPEGVLMGFLAAEGHLTPVLVISLFVANFPEAFSSSSLLVLGKIPVYAIIGMWTLLCILVGCLAGLSCKLLLVAYPDFSEGMKLPIEMLLIIAIVEGVTGGAMIACISSVMLPEAFERAGKDGSLFMSSGFLCTSGFLTAVFLKAALG